MKKSIEIKKVKVEFFDGKYCDSDTVDDYCPFLDWELGNYCKLYKAWLEKSKEKFTVSDYDCQETFESELYMRCEKCIGEKKW